jgi:hypothetical protein
MDITTTTQNGNKWEENEVHVNDLHDTHVIASKDPTVYASLEYYYRFLKLSDIELKGNDTEHRQTWFNQHIKGCFKKILFHLIIHGYCGFTKHLKSFDASRDHEWMKLNRTQRDENQMGYDVKQVVITVPDWNAYNHRMRRNTRTLEHEVCGETNTDPVGTTRKRHHKVIHMLTTNKFSLPFYSTGRLQTPVATLINSYMELRQMELFNLNACYQLAHPIPFLQFQTGLKEEELLSRVKSATFGENALNEEKNKQIYLAVQEGNRMLSEEVNQANERSLADIEKTRNYYINPLDVSKTTQLSTIMDRRVELPPGKELTKNTPPSAVVPAGLQEMYHRWTEKVSNVFSLPYSLLSKDKIGGGNAGKQYADADLKMLQKTIADLTAVMEDIFKQLYIILEMDASEQFVLHPQPFVDFEMLLACYDHRLIDKEQLQIEIEDSYALKRKKGSVNISATHDMLAEMKKTESITKSEYKIGMKKIYGLDFDNE